LQLQQRRDAAGRPEDYWREALRRDGDDSRCNNALGVWHLQRGDFIEAEAHFRRAIAALTVRNPNAHDREPFYYLGLTLRYQERDDEAHDAFQQAGWSLQWRAPALYAIAEIETKRGNYGVAPKYLYEALRLNADNNNARNLAAVLFRRFGRTNEAQQLLRESLALDPLDAWACHLTGSQMPGDNQIRLDLAFDYARAGLFEAAIEVLAAADLFVEDGLPSVHYALASFYTRTGDLGSAQREYLAAAQSSPELYVPHRLEELVILARAVALQPHDARAQYYLANLLYDQGRYEEAIELWESSAQMDGTLGAVWRNLGAAYYNWRDDIPKAFDAFDKALSADKANASILYERDQLWKLAGVPPAIRLKELEEHLSLAESFDDLAAELAALFNDVHQPVRALALLSSHQFQSGTGLVLEQHVRTHLNLGRQALRGGDPMRALNLFFAALHPPASLGGTQQQPAHSAEVWFWLGEAYQAAQEYSSAQEYWRQAARQGANFQEIARKLPLEIVLYSGLALDRLGERFAGRKLLRELWFQGRKLAREKQQENGLTIAPSAPHRFKEDPTKRNRVTGLFLQAQARWGLGQFKLARRLFDQVLTLDPNHSRALDLAVELPQDR
jgi:tetratricopeptide (TPR) repeat protein